MAYSSLGDFNKVFIISGALKVKSSNCSAKVTPSLIKLARRSIPSSFCLQERESHLVNISLLFKLFLNSCQKIAFLLYHSFLFFFFFFLFFILFFFFFLYFFYFIFFFFFSSFFFLFFFFYLFSFFFIIF